MSTRIEKTVVIGIGGETLITGNSTFIKQLNQMTILRTIQKQNGISRLELARTIGVSNSTISTLVGELIASGIVKELGEGKSIGGRRPIRIGINEEGGYILGVDIGSSKITCAIVDLQAQIREIFVVDMPADRDAKIPALIELIRQTREAGKAKGMDNYLGIGIATPGLVDFRNGVVVSSSNLGWKHVELRKEVEYHTGLKTIVDNNANAAALGEHYYGAGADADHLLYLSVGNGIGAGIIVGGSLLTGMRNGAGEVGHMQMDPNGPACLCGRVGCLETYSSGISIEKKALKVLDESAQLREFYHREGKITTEYIFQCAKEGDAAARKLVDEALEYLAMATRNLIHMFNPDLVIFGGGLSNSGDYFLRQLTGKLEDVTAKEQNQGIEFKVSSLGNNSGVLGAATLVIQQMFRPINANF